MAKRFHDTDIWDEDWFIDLPKDYRDFWLYVKDKCDHAGIYRPNTTKFNKLYDCSVNTKDFLNKVNNEKERIVVLSNGRWLIPDFISFQYGNHLNTNNRVHNSILKVLSQNEVKLTSIRGLKDLTQGLKDKDKDKDKDSINIKNKNNIYNFEEIYLKYPKRVGKKNAERHFKASVKTEQDWANINQALENYLKSKVYKKGYVQNASTWFNNWKDWVELAESEKFCEKCKDKGKYTNERGYEMICSCPAGLRVEK